MRGTHGVYLVCGRRKYRGHEPGTQFEAVLSAQVEQRAIRRGDIQLIERVTPVLKPGSYRLPEDWPATANNTNPTSN
jgi:hypothetical protein